MQFGKASTSSPDLLKKKEVALRLSCGERTVDRMVADGQLTPVYIRSSVRFRRIQVEAIINGEGAR